MRNGLAELRMKSVVVSKKRKQLSLNSRNVSRKNKKNRLSVIESKPKRLQRKHEQMLNEMLRLKPNEMLKRLPGRQNLRLLKNSASPKSEQPKSKKHFSAVKQHPVHCKNSEHVLNVKGHGPPTSKFLSCGTITMTLTFTLSVLQVSESTAVIANLLAVANSMLMQTFDQILENQSKTLFGQKVKRLREPTKCSSITTRSTRSDAQKIQQNSKLLPTHTAI